MKSALGCPSATWKRENCLQQPNAVDCGLYLLAHIQLVVQHVAVTGSLCHVPVLELQEAKGKRQECLRIVNDLIAQSVSHKVENREPAVVGTTTDANDSRKRKIKVRNSTKLIFIY